MQQRLALAEQPRDVLRAGRVAAQHAVLAAEPQIAWLRRGDFRQRRSLVCLLLVDRIAQQRVEFVYVESREPEVKIQVVQLGEFHRKELFIPRRLLIGAIVSQAKAADLRRREVLGNVDGYFRQTEKPTRRAAQVTDNDDLVDVHHYWLPPAVLARLRQPLSRLPGRSICERSWDSLSGDRWARIQSACCCS